MYIRFVRSQKKKTQLYEISSVHEKRSTKLLLSLRYATRLTTIAMCLANNKKTIITCTSGVCISVNVYETYV